MSKIMTLIIPIKGDEVLLGMKKRDFGVGRWNGFGGKVNAGETIEEAVKREISEEVGVTVNEIKQIGTLDFSAGKNGEILTVHIFNTFDFIGEPSESDEMIPRWFKNKDIPFNEMWPDDIFWFPLFLAGEKFKGYFVFDEGNNKVMEYKLEKYNFFMSDNVIKVGAGVVIIKDGKTLLTKRKGAHAAGSYGSLGGHVEFGESPIEAVKREAREELGIEIGNIKFSCCTSMIKYGQHYLDISFVAEIISGEPKIMEPDRIESLDWYAIDNLPEPLFEPVKRVFDTMKKEEIYNEVRE